MVFFVSGTKTDLFHVFVVVLPQKKSIIRPFVLNFLPNFSGHVSQFGCPRVFEASNMVTCCFAEEHQLCGLGPCTGGREFARAGREMML